MVVEGRKMKIAVMSPTNRLSGIYYWLDLIELLFNIAKKHEVIIRFDDSVAPLDMKREHLAEFALQNNADYLLFIDTDMRFEPDLFDRLVKHGKDIISGVYMDRVSGFTPKHIKNQDLFVKCIEQKKLCKLKTTGFGIMLIKSEVFRKTKKPWFKFPEDYNWSLDVRKQGYDIWCDCNTWLGHGVTEKFRYYELKEGKMMPVIKVKKK